MHNSEQAVSVKPTGNRPQVAAEAPSAPHPSRFPHPIGLTRRQIRQIVLDTIG